MLHTCVDKLPTWCDYLCCRSWLWLQTAVKMCKCVQIMQSYSDVMIRLQKHAAMHLMLACNSRLLTHPASGLHTEVWHAERRTQC